jgi:hypothetical protein
MLRATWDSSSTPLFTTSGEDLFSALQDSNSFPESLIVHQLPCQKHGNAKFLQKYT